MNRGIVYVMSNELFPDLVKIGVTGGTTAEAVEKRRKRLSSSENMPQPFEVKYAICVNEYKEIEKIIHKGIAKLRHNPNREFFNISVDEAIQLLYGYIVSGAAVEIPIKNSVLLNEKKAIKNIKTKRSKSITFKSLNIPVGTTLVFANNPRLKVKTNNDSRCVFLPDGSGSTLSIAAKKFRDQTNPNNGIKGLPDGAKYFMYKGKTLLDLSKEMKVNNVES